LRRFAGACPVIEVRPFRRGDREQLTHLVNRHVAAVIPGVVVSVNTVLSQLEREPGEFKVDPWVTERLTLVAEQRGRVVAAAHLLGYADREDVGECYRGSGEIRWCVFWPPAPYWPDSTVAAESLMAACVRQLDAWGTTRQHADGSLPAPGVYGVSAQWPHVQAIYQQAGFVCRGPIEIVSLARIEDLPTSTEPPFAGMGVRRSVGINGTRLAAWLGGGEMVGYIEVDSLEEGGRFPRHGGLADIGNLEVAEAYRGRGLGRWLVAEAAEWLRLGDVARVLAYARSEEEQWGAFLSAVGFRELSRTQRGWLREAAGARLRGP
jgi:ribosomal protein S18 acetylase RimI-like enzyme